MEPIVELRGITKRFPGIIANDNIDLTLEKGEVLALLGENGAGKSTLMSVLFGFYHPDAGEIFVRGKKVDISNPNIAYDLGIGMVHQHFKLIENFTVTENIILGDEPRNWMMVDMKVARERVRELSETYNLNVDPDAKIESISVGMQQRVEILKVLYRDAEIIILDEPTAVLTPQEIEELMGILRNFVKEGKSVIMITHKLKEIMAIADRVSVLRQGKMVGTLKVSETSEEELAELMVGRKVSFEIDKEPAKPGEVALEIEDLWVKDARQLDAVRGLNLSIREGEILGLAGIDGNGQRELVEALTGLRDIDRGRVKLFGTEYQQIRSEERTDLGIGHIPEDRQKRGLILDFKLFENMLLEKYESEPYSKNGILQFPAIREKAQELVEVFDVRSGEGIDSFVRTMSGGNQQKAIVGREIDLSPRLMIASQPTRGLDVGAIEYIHSRLVELRDQGTAVLLVSFELDEIFNLSDRIAVIYQGRIVGIRNPHDTDEMELGLLMSGSKEIKDEEIIQE
ncbi:MAG TPA: ABC transporter ATP-binding protein [Tissierellia bacterium]|nr:ABC transporter ATP-binding protein [Tissierellia bacterium]